MFDDGCGASDVSGLSVAGGAELIEMRFRLYSKKRIKLMTRATEKVFFFVFNIMHIILLGLVCWVKCLIVTRLCLCVVCLKGAHVVTHLVGINGVGVFLKTKVGEVNV